MGFLIVFLMYWFCVNSCDANRCEIGQAWQAWQAWQVWQAWKLAGQAFSLEYSFHVAGVVFKRHFLDDCVAIFNLEKNHETAQDILGSYSVHDWEITVTMRTLMQNCDTRIVKLKLMKIYFYFLSNQKEPTLTLWFCMRGRPNPSPRSQAKTQSSRMGI